jgi:hypothetical protein
MYLFGEAGTGAVLYKVNSYNPPNGMIGVYREKSFAFLETSEFYAGVEIYPVNWIMLFGRAGLVFGGFTSYGIAGNIDLSGISIGCGAMISPFPLKSRRR